MMTFISVYPNLSMINGKLTVYARSESKRRKRLIFYVFLPGSNNENFTRGSEITKPCVIISTFFSRVFIKKLFLF